MCKRENKSNKGNYDNVERYHGRTVQKIRKREILKGRKSRVYGTSSNKYVVRRGGKKGSGREKIKIMKGTVTIMKGIVIGWRQNKRVIKRTVRREL